MSQRGGSQSAGDSGGESKRDLKRRMDEAIQALSSLDLSPGEPVMDPKKPPGKMGNEIKLDTNVYGIKKGSVIAYRYDVTITGVLRGGRQGERVVEFTKRTREDAVVVDRKDKSRIAFTAFVRCFPQDFGPDPTALYYDLQSVLYTLEQLNLDGNDKTFTVLVNQLTDDERNYINISTLDRIDMLVKKVSSHFEVALNDHSAITDDVSRIDHSLLTFLELATSQYALFTPTEHVSYGGGKSFLLNPQNHGFTQNDCPSLRNGHYLAVGAEKSCRFFEGPKQRGGTGVGLIVQTTKAPFHMAEQTLIDKASDILVNANVLLGQGQLEQRDIQTLNKQMKSLCLSVFYGPITIF
ncbi:WAGO-2 protein [Aphelenchoides avenae]|nr:WAGO-2 protein [Aphelenchus avenae]